MLLPSLPEEGQGPGAKASGKVFYNPAMSGSRTRSVLLLRHALEEGFLGEGAVYALDGLTASGLRARRWLNESFDCTPEQASFPPPANCSTSGTWVSPGRQKSAGKAANALIQGSSTPTAT